MEKGQREKFLDRWSNKNNFRMIMLIEVSTEGKAHHLDAIFHFANSSLLHLKCSVMLEFLECIIECID